MRGERGMRSEVERGEGGETRGVRREGGRRREGRGER